MITLSRTPCEDKHRLDLTNHLNRLCVLAQALKYWDIRSKRLASVSDGVRVRSRVVSNVGVRILSSNFGRKA